MSDINISYSLGSPPSPTQQDTTLWSFNHTDLLPSAGNLVIAQPKRGGPGALLQQEVAHALSQCWQFRTLDAHLKQIVAAMPPLREHMDDTRQTLKQFTENGLLESSEQAWERLTKGAPNKILAACSLCILTCDRPDALKRLLSHLTDIPTEVDQLWVIDDSRSADALAANAEIIAEHASACPLPVRHCDLTLREKLISQLKASAPDAKDSIDWLLSRAQWNGLATYGQARNLALLLNVGRRILMLDDDILPVAVAPPLASMQLAFSRGNDSDAVLWQSKDEMASQALPLAESPLSLMLEPLGASLGNLPSLRALSHNSLEGTDGELVGAFDASSPILIGQCGYWGDPGSGDSMWLSHMPPTTIKRTLEAHSDLEAAMGARAAWSGHRGPSLTPFAVKSAQTGVDHTVLMPPYFPVGRVEDLFFGILTQRIHPQSIVHNAGWAIRHEPVDPRNERIPMTPMSVTPGIMVLLDWLGREPNDQWGLTPERRLNGVAEQVWRLTEMDTTALDTLVRRELASKRGAQLRQCMDSLGQFTTLEHLPGFPQWRTFVEQSRDALLAEIQEPEPAPLSQWLANSKTFSADGLRQGGAAFAKALQAWPKICEAAQGFAP